MTIKDFIFSNTDYFQDFITRSTYHSNRIEGNTLSYAETYAILWNDNSIKIQNAKPRELFEATNHKYALNYVLNHLSDELSEKMIKHIGIQMNKNISEIDGYRKTAVFIRGAEYVPPAAEQVPQQMMYFVYNYNKTTQENVFTKIADFHLQLERIHPFSDGNGRTGRMLIAFELLKNNIPAVVIPADDRKIYFEIMAKNDITAMSEFLKNLSVKEYNRMKQFGFKKEEIKGVHNEHHKGVQQ